MAQQEYLKRLQPYARVVMHEIKEVPFASMKERQAVLLKESHDLKKATLLSPCRIMLDAKGKQFMSEDFANSLQKLAEHGDELTFIIGGPLGIHESICNDAHLRLSLSSLTFTHQLARIVLFEQIYRAMTIVRGKQYHY